MRGIYARWEEGMRTGGWKLSAYPVAQGCLLCGREGTWYGANDTSCIFLRLSESCFVAPSCYGSDFLLLHTSRGFLKKVRRREKGNFKGIEDFSYCQVYFSRIAFRKTKKKYSASILFLSVNRSDELQKVARRTKNFSRILQKKLYRVRKATSIFYNARGLLHFSAIPSFGCRKSRVRITKTYGSILI